MKVATVATKDEGFFQNFLQSAKKHNINVDVLCWGEEWQGFGHKIKAMITYLQNVQDNEIVMFVDAYDVIFLRNLDGLEKDYRALTKTKGDRVLVSAVAGKLNKIFMAAMFGKCGSHEINSGTYIGYAYLLKKILGEMCFNGTCDDKHADDQRLLTAFCNRHQNLFDFDSHNKWFLIWGSLDFHVTPDVKIQDGRLFYGPFEPYVLHCPGNKDMSGILMELGYKVYTKRRENVAYYRKIYKNHLLYIIQTYGWMTIPLAFWLYRFYNNRYKNHLIAFAG